MAKKKIIKLSEKNRRIGDDHPKAVLTDEEVEAIRSLHDDEMFGYAALRKHCFDVFGKTVSKSTIAMLVRYERRNTTFGSSKTVHITED